jgi:predicted transcriptional regulator YdeE
MERIEQFSVIGISVKTTNENGQAMQDIPKLWNSFLTESIAEKIPNKADNTVYCIYTDYEGAHTKPYTTILGCKVLNLDNIPDGLIGKTFDTATYSKHTAKGNILQGLIFDEWTKIWNANLDRAFTADFEVYGDKAQNPENAEVDIYVSVK